MCDTGRVQKVDLAEKLAQITEHWRPKVVGELNGQEVKLVEHRTAADEEAAALVFEPAATRNTGNVEDARFTAPGGVRI